MMNKETKMNLKAKAALQVVAMLSAAVFASVVVETLLKNFEAETILYGLGLGILAFVIYQLYAIRLSQLEYEQATEKRNGA